MISRNQLIVTAILFGCTVGLWVLVYTLERSNTQLEVMFLNVGQGDATYIETPSDIQVLIDGGPNTAVLRELGSVMPFWDRSIDVVIATHPDLDHIGGLVTVLERLKISTLIIPGVGSDTDVYDRLIESAEKKGVTILLAREGRMVLDTQYGVYMDVLFPDRDVRGVERNLGSIVSKVVYGETSFLFTGDSPQSIEKYLIQTKGDELDVDVLKLGHHGSDTSSSLEFLGYTSPEIAVISAGKDNSYGHPHAEVLERLIQFEIPYKNTAEHGRVVFVSNGTEIEVR